MNSKTHNYQQPNLKKQKQKSKLSQQLEQEQNHGMGDHMEVISREGERAE